MTTFAMGGAIGVLLLVWRELTVDHPVIKFRVLADTEHHADHDADPHVTIADVAATVVRQAYRTYRRHGVRARGISPGVRGQSTE